MPLSLDDLTSILGAPAQTATPARYQSPQQWRTQLALDRLEDQEDLPRGLLTAVLTRESSGYNTAKSPKGAQGLFQFMPATATSYGIDPLDPGQAAAAAAKELGSHYKRYGGDMPQTLAAWNWGSGKLQQQGMARAPKATRNFITWVTGMLSPQSADAAERRPRPPGQGQAPAGALTLGDLEQRLGTPTPQAPQPVPAPDASQGGVPLVRGPAQPLVDPRATPTGAAPLPTQLVIDIEKSSTPGPAALPSPGPAPAAGPGPAPAHEQGATATPPARTEDTGLLSDLPWWAKTGLATATSAGLGLGGAALGSLAVPGVGTVAGELLGSAGARWLNVKLGLEEPGLVGDIASVAVPAAFRGAGALLRGGVPRLPGAGIVRHEMAQEGLEQLGERLGPQTASHVLFGQAAQHNAAIPTLNLWRTAGGILREQQGKNPSARTGELMHWAQEILDLARQHGGPIPMQRLETLRQDLGRAIGGDPGMRALYGSLMDDLESAMARNVPGAAQLRQGIAAYRQERALDDLMDLWAPGKGIQTLPSGDVQIYGRRILNTFEKKLTDDPRFRGSFRPDELADIHETLRAVNRLAFGSPAGGSLSRRAAEVTGAITGTSLGGPVGGVVGAAVPAVLAYAMRSAPGRAAIRQALAEGNGRITAAGYAAITAVVRKGLETAEPQRPQPGLSGSPGQWP